LALSLSLSLSLQGLLLATGGFSIRFPEIARLGTEEVVSKGVSAVSGVFGSRFELLALLRSGVGFCKFCLCAASRVSSFGSQGVFLEGDRAFLLPVSSCFPGVSL
jgi:hypothetical protein